MVSMMCEFVPFDSHRLRVLQPLVCGLLCVCMGGCFRYHAAKGEMPTAVAFVGEDAWVVSDDTTGLARLLDTPEELVLWELDREIVREKYPDLTDEEIDQAQEQMKLRLEHAEIRNGGIVRFWGPGGSGMKVSRSITRGPISIKLEDFESRGDFLSAERYTFLEDGGASAIDGVATWMLDILLKSEGITRTDAERDWLIREGIRIGLPDIESDDPDGARVASLGTVVHIASFYENSYEHRVLDRLEGYGWVIGHIGSDIHVVGPNTTAQIEQHRQQRAYREELLEQDEQYQRVHNISPELPRSVADLQLEADRYIAASKTASEKYPMLDTGLEVYSNTDLEAHGRMLAGIVDQRIAEHAYAAEALIAESDRLNPDLADKPIVVMGFSAGALVSPAVTARLRGLYPDRQIALVMIGGGGDVVSSSAESVFEVGKLDFAPREGPEPTDEQLDELAMHYRAASKLDPLVLAPSLADVPTLHIYAKRDTVVPTSAAEAFNEAHGHVDRLVHPLNHDTLFFFVPGEVGRIKTWLRDHGFTP